MTGKKGMTKFQHTRGIANASLARRQAMIEYARDTGRGPKNCCAHIGVAYQTYKSWRVRYPDFGPQFDEARRAFKNQKHGYDGSFVSFRKAYLRMDTTWFQQQIIDAIESARPGEIVLVLIPPGHGKTTLLEDWCTYKLVTDPTYRITVGSETVDHGAKVVDRVRSRLELDGPTPEIERDFGPIGPQDRNQTWGQRRFDVAGKRTSDERDFSMNCVGITGRVQGTRCDLLLLDDLQDVKSIEQSDKYYDIVTQSFISRPEMFGRTVMIGTRVGEFDVYRKLIDAELPDKVIRIPAYSVSESPPWPAPTKKPKEDDPSTWAPEGVKFLWPEKYDQFEEGGAHIPGLERFRYAKMRFQAKEQTWWRIYMQRPEAASSMTFDEKTTERMKDPHRSVIADPRGITLTEDPTMAEEWPERSAGRPVPVVIAVDPAVGGGNGVLSAACRPTRMEVLSAHLNFGLTKYSQIIDIIEADCVRYMTRDSVVTVVVIEDKAFQKGLLDDDRLIELQRRFGFRIIPNTTGRDKTDKDIGVPSMEHAMVREEITIPWADELSRKEMEDLLGHLHQWRPNVKATKLPQDLVMCLWFAYRQWLVIRDSKVYQHQASAGWQASGSPIRRRRSRTMVRSSYSHRRLRS